MTYPDPTIDRIEAAFKALADDVNATSGSTRGGWLFFLALQAYFFVALAGISHRDLLLDTPIALPLLQVEVNLKEFFRFGPMIFVLVHMGILLQHVMLARQARDLHARIANFEGQSLFRTHRVRSHLHSYVFTQLIAGGKRSPFFSFFLALLTWLSLGILPVALLLDFQITFLPYHDLQATWAHRAYLAADLFIVMIFSVFMRHPTMGFVSGFGRTMVERPISFLASLLLGAAAMFFSMSVATIPDEQMDRLMTALWPRTLSDDEVAGGQPREAFVVTAALFDGKVDPLSGRSVSPFGRNLVVTDTDLVKDGAFDEGEASLNLRFRDLRYGKFDRSDLHQADFTGANLTRTSLRETNLVEVKAERAILRGADLANAQFLPFASLGRPANPINLRGADLRNANMAGADLRAANLQGTLLEGADLRGARLDPEVSSEAARQGARL